MMCVSIAAGGASALIAVLGPASVHEQRFLFPMLPIATGAVIILIVGIVINNLTKRMQYPIYWI
jgi:CBS-domain-containing membrane protein